MYEFGLIVIGILIGIILSTLFVYFFIPKFRDSILGPIIDKAKEKADDIVEQANNEKNHAQELAQEAKKGADEAAQKAVENQMDSYKKTFEATVEALNKAKTQWSTQQEASDRDFKQFTKYFYQWSEALSNPAKSGLFGEDALESLIKGAGFVKDHTYLKQVTVDEGTGSGRPDFYIKTKENNYFVIDSKCPMGKYDDFIKAQTEKEKKNCLDALSKNVKFHIKHLGKKDYSNESGNRFKKPPFTIMFVPNAALYLDVIHADSEAIFKLSQEHNVMVSPPAMILPLLQLSRKGLLEEGFDEKVNLFKQLLVKLIKGTEAVQKHFSTSVKHLDNARNSLSSFQNTWNTKFVGPVNEIKKTQNLVADDVKKLQSPEEADTFEAEIEEATVIENQENLINED